MIETEANRDSMSTYERGPFLFGLLAALVGPVQNIFFFTTLLHFIDSHCPTSWPARRAASPFSYYGSLFLDTDREGEPGVDSLVDYHFELSSTISDRYLDSYPIPLVSILLYLTEMGMVNPGSLVSKRSHFIPKLRAAGPAIPS